MAATTKQLHDAIQSGYYDQVRTLVIDGADLNDTLDDITAIQYAALKGNRRIVGLLLSFHETGLREIEELRAPFGDSMDSLIVVAAKSGWFDILRRMLDFGGYENKDLRVAMLGAIEMGSTKCVQVLDGYMHLVDDEVKKYIQAATKADRPGIIDYLVKKQIPGLKRARYGWM